MSLINTRPKGALSTPFSESWSDYRETKEYKEIADWMKNKGMNQPYIDNVIFIIFTAGYNSK